MNATALRAFADFVEYNIDESCEEKVLSMPLDGYDNRVLGGRGSWIMEIRDQRTGEVRWACTLPKHQR